MKSFALKSLYKRQRLEIKSNRMKLEAWSLFSTAVNKIKYKDINQGREIKIKMMIGLNTRNNCCWNHTYQRKLWLSRKIKKKNKVLDSFSIMNILNSKNKLILKHTKEIKKENSQPRNNLKNGWHQGKMKWFINS